ncbi:RND transporter [candidate division KSB3 bacterium]|uniref:RND transporter n=1 Tax=candidate division KSB3 bacterium TaxID=2044937 RepID=A0A2G6K912_9BACT|nr:MAG: RND transporter [candidate division KSB3 bacterium]
MFKRALIEFSVEHYKLVTVITIVLAVLGLSQFPKMQIDTDPENMLPEDEFVRVFDRDVKQEFLMHDMIVLGIVNETHPEGVFNVETLTKIHNITEGIKDIEGVVGYDVMALSTVDDIQQGESEGAIRFQWMMQNPPVTEEEAQYIGERVKANPMLDGTLISENGKAVGIYVPITTKTVSYQVSQKIGELIKQEKTGDEHYYVTGLPVAQDTFGYEMFSQMMWSAPVAGLIIFLLMWLFFKNIKLIIAPMIVAVVSIIYSMGLLIAFGYTVHIMSSMIAIFLTPIAVVNSVHIISTFFDEYQEYKDRKKTILAVMDRLFYAMLYTSLTTFAGFVSLAVAPIPPTQVFGIFVGIGIAAAWLLTMTFIPASVMFISEDTLENFGAKVQRATDGHEIKEAGMLANILDNLGRFTHQRAGLILVLTLIVAIISAVGIFRININDNPVKWFDENHDIRVADRVLNEHFGGTYMAHLVFEADRKNQEFFDSYYQGLSGRLELFIEDFGEYQPELADELQTQVAKLYKAGQGDLFHEKMTAFIQDWEEQYADDEAASEFVEELVYFWDDEQLYTETFKQPAVLSYIADLEDFMTTAGAGKSSSVATIVKKVYQELRGGTPEYFAIPETPNAVGESLIQYQNSHRPNDLWHFVNTDYSKINIWVQLKSGDNQDMVHLEQQVDEYIRQNPPPVPMNHSWAGLTYINVVWQNKMVRGMLDALSSSYVVVLIMMVILFRSVLWGILSMIPLTVTIGFIYGFIGFIGKDYDMPVAILSSLTLGLSVDFAIHFLERSRELYKEEQSWQRVASRMFHEPARAIARNIIVIALGFLPLLLSQLVPYQTVGFFLSAIMLVSGVGTLFILPAAIKFLQKWLFKKYQQPENTGSATGN